MEEVGYRVLLERKGGGKELCVSLCVCVQVCVYVCVNVCVGV